MRFFSIQATMHLKTQERPYIKMSSPKVLHKAFELSTKVPLLLGIQILKYLPKIHCLKGLNLTDYHITIL